MLNPTLPSLLFIRTCIALFRCIPPLSSVYTLARATTLLPRDFRLLLPVEIYLFSEAVFFSVVYLPRRYLLQRAAKHPPPLPPHERKLLFERCLDNTPDIARYLSGWFHGASVEDIRRGNIREFVQWAFFDGCAGVCEEEELESYVCAIEGKLGRNFAEGYARDVKCVRLTLDPVVMEYRSLLWYSMVYTVDAVTCLRMRAFGFAHFSPNAWLHVFPPRPHMMLGTASPVDHMTYWFRKHSSRTKLPIVFVHGIGIGLYPYVDFLREISADPSVGVLVLEILPISFRLSCARLDRAEFVAQFAAVLAHHGVGDFLLISHSYGTVLSTWLLHSPLSPRIRSLLLIDPVCILLHHPSVAYKFFYRVPNTANEHQLQYFASRDPSVAHSLSRNFFWAENILWKEELLGRRVGVVISDRDLIVDSRACWKYLTGQDGGRDVFYDQSGQLTVIWCEGLDHAQVFDTKERRVRVVGLVEEFVGSE